MAAVCEVEYLRRSLDAHAIVAVTDARGRITYVNEKFCELSKYSESELMGRDHRVINSGFHSKEFFRNLWATISQGNVWKGEIRNRAKDGSHYWVATTISPSMLPSGKPGQYVSIRTDITALKRLEHELLSLNDRVQSRIGRDLHDGLGQRLTALELFAQGLMQDVRSRAPDLEASAKLLSVHLREAVAQTRLLSHGLAPISLHDQGLLVALRELAEGTTALTRVRFTFEGESAPKLVGDTAATHLYRIAQEAVNNALKHGHPSWIKIRLRSLDSGWLLSVEDNGTGFSTPHETAPGLGLRMMRYRASTMGASLSFQSTPGKGTCVQCQWTHSV